MKLQRTRALRGDCKLKEPLSPGSLLTFPRSSNPKELLERGQPMASRVITNFRTAPARTLTLPAAGNARWILCAILLLAVVAGAHAIGAPASFEHRRGLLAIVAAVFVAGVLLRRLK